MSIEKLLNDLIAVLIVYSLFIVFFSAKQNLKHIFVISLCIRCPHLKKSRMMTMLMLTAKLIILQ